MTDRKPPNYHDQSCGFGEDAPHTPDVAGTLLGLRGFALTDDGYLRGVTYTVPWTTGWNDAVCLVARRVHGRPSTPRPGFAHPIWGHVHDASHGCLFPLDPGEPVEFEDDWEPDPCQGLEPDCACGFYAYYDQQTGRTSGYGNIRGVIEAAGKCVVGPKGFRAARARIVAVVQPKDFKPRLSGVKQREINSLRTLVSLLVESRRDMRLRPWFGGANKYALLWGTAVSWTVILGKGAPHGAALLGAVAAVTSIVGVLTLTSRRRTRRLMAALDGQIADGRQQIAGLTADVDLDAVMTLVREHYPDVKVYPTMVALLADYPPSDVRGLLGIEIEDPS